MQEDESISEREMKDRVYKHASYTSRSSNDALHEDDLNDGCDNHVTE